MMMQDKKIFASRWDITNDLGEWSYEEEKIDYDSINNYTTIYGALSGISNCFTTRIVPFWDYTNLHLLAQGYMGVSLKFYLKRASITDTVVGLTPLVVKLDNDKINSWVGANLEDYVKSVRTDNKNKIGHFELNDLERLGYEKKNQKYSIPIFLMELNNYNVNENGINRIRVSNINPFEVEYILPHEEILDNLARDFIFKKENEEITNFLNYHLSKYQGETEIFLSHLEILMDNTVTTATIFEAKKEVLVWINQMRKKYDLSRHLIVENGIKELKPADAAQNEQIKATEIMYFSVQNPRDGNTIFERRIHLTKTQKKELDFKLEEYSTEFKRIFDTLCPQFDVRLSVIGDWLKGKNKPIPEKKEFLNWFISEKIGSYSFDFNDYEDTESGRFVEETTISITDFTRRFIPSLIDDYLLEFCKQYADKLERKDLQISSPKEIRQGKVKKIQTGGNRVTPLKKQLQIDIFKNAVTELCNQNRGKAKIDRLNLSQITNRALSARGIDSYKTLDRYIISLNLGRTHNQYSGQLVRQYCTDNSLNINYFN